MAAVGLVCPQALPPAVLSALLPCSLPSCRVYFMLGAQDRVADESPDVKEGENQSLSTT